MAVKRSCKKGKGMKIDIAKQLAKCGADIYKIVNANKGGSDYHRLAWYPYSPPKNYKPTGPYYPKKGGIFTFRGLLNRHLKP